MSAKEMKPAVPFTKPAIPTKAKAPATYTLETLTLEVVDQWAGKHGYHLVAITPEPPKKQFTEVASYRIATERVEQSPHYSPITLPDYDPKPPEAPAAILGSLLVKAETLSKLGFDPIVRLELKLGTSFHHSENRLVLGVMK